MTKKEKIWIKSMEFGHILGCHQMESRRLITGTLCGVGLTYCYFYGIVFVIKLIAKI